MFKLIGFVVWTAFAMGVGAFAVTALIDGRTPLAGGQRWRGEPVEVVKKELVNALESAQGALSRPSQQPAERHTPDEREAVNKLVAKQSGQK